MDIPEFFDLKEGDRVRLIDGNGDAYAVNGLYGDYATAVKVQHVACPSEWLSNGEPLKSIASLSIGSILQYNLGRIDPYVVTSVHKSFALAVQTILIKESECVNWLCVAKAQFELRP